MSESSGGNPIWTTPPENIGFVSTRFAGTDGVSMEAGKWGAVFADQGHKCFWYAGVLDTDPSVSHCVPEVFFGHPDNEWIERRIWGKIRRAPETTERIHSLTARLKGTLYEFVDRFDIGVLVFQNVLAIPMHVPLGMASTEFIFETGMPAIAHHHDFFWERTRFSANAVDDYLDMAFPPRAVEMQHVVINQAAQGELARRKALPSLVIPNVLDFESPPPPPDAYAADLREEIGLEPDDIFILQPTRVIPRKGIGHAINLVHMLNNPKCKLVISHEAGDEGTDYQDMLVNFAKRSGVDLKIIATRVGEERKTDSEGRKTYRLWDIYPHADFITYPSLYEGFGNAFLEALYFKKPVLVNRYGVFATDIQPKGFRVPIIEGYLTKEIIAEVRRLLEDADYRTEVVEHNYRVATRHFSYAVLRRSLRTLITNFRGLEV